jgi:hypothetical protein
MLQSQRSQYETTQRYGATQHLAHLSSPKAKFDRAAADRDADRKFSGGFNISKRNICSKCYEAKSTNGSCSCES